MESAQSFQTDMRPSLHFSPSIGRVKSLHKVGNQADVHDPRSILYPRISLALNGHDYRRDTSSGRTDDVDVDAVNQLLGERLLARKKGDFGIADKIRDELSAEHKVTVFDQDKLWVTGDGAVNRGGRGERGGRGDMNRGGRGGRGRGRGRGGNRNFGPNGHDYNLCAQAGPTSSHISESAIHAKVAERLMAKMNRDFDTADRVQLELAEKGVYINDKTKEWRADGVQFIDPSEGRRTPSDRNRPYVQSRHSLPVPETATYTEELIEKAVMERDRQKRAKSFTKADTIRDTLERDYNVLVDDRIREWSIGGSFGKEADLKRATNIAMKSRSYAKSSASLDLPDGVREEEVQARVDARTAARSNRQYAQSDVMRDEILEEFNVVIHDMIKMWSVGGDFGMDDPHKVRAKELSTYTRRGGGDLSEDDVVLIQDMLTTRFEEKRARNFNQADEIRSKLYNLYNVNVNDKTREWRVLSDDYVQTKAERGARELTEEEVEIVKSQIVKRAALKKSKSYQEADAIRDELQDVYSVLVDDKTMEWKVVSSGRNSRFAAEAAISQSSSFKQKKVESAVDEDFDSIFNRVKGELGLQPDSAISESNTISTDTIDKEDDEEEHAPLLAESAPSRDELMTLTVPLLKDKLREAGMPVSGKKADLVDRLLS